MSRSLKYKLILFFLPLCLLPLLGISLFSYLVAKERITEDRIVLYLEQIAQDISDTIQLTLLEKKEETVSITLYGEIRNFLMNRRAPSPQMLLDKLVLVHEVYDIIAIFDLEGRLLLCNGHNRSWEPLDQEKLRLVRGTELVTYTPDSTWLEEVRSGRFGFLDWHRSPLVNQLYDYSSSDIAQQYSIGFAAPIMDETTIVGGVLLLMNWQFVQEILDKVEEDFKARSLASGYAFLFGRDHNTIIGHKYRRHRAFANSAALSPALDNYGTRLTEDHGLHDLRLAVATGKTNHLYNYPENVAKISGLAPVNHEFFRWICGVGINNEDIFAPVQDLRTILIWTSSISALLVVVLTFSVARQITTPLKELRRSASVIEAGDYSQRVEISSRDEIGELANTFNSMAQSLEERSNALIDLNRRLEEKVSERTRELEQTNREVENAYRELKETQVQLIQSEKMASLGQLVAGIAHEIKNPLNFIYGNTDFLRKYVQNLRRLIQLYESDEFNTPEGRKSLESLKHSVNYSFMLEDLDTLIENFEEGAQRIHSIISDLKTFSRMDTDQFREVDIHEPIDLALNLLHNEYRDRIRIHKEYGEVPKVQCHPGKMSQVFMNLLSNACQAIQDEGDIWIRTASSNGRVTVDVEDSGAGIKGEHLGKIFEPFFTTKPVGKGTGLGLSISYGIVQQHKGTIEVQSRKSQGTRFRVHLPLKS
ncbi:MAG: ATP-binding protein [Acidobacteriota bacterium]